MSIGANPEAERVLLASLLEYPETITRQWPWGFDLNILPRRTTACCSSSSFNLGKRISRLRSRQSSLKSKNLPPPSG